MLRYAVKLALLITMMVASAIGSSHVWAVEQFRELWKVNNWSGFIFYNSNGQFDRCSAIVNFTDGTTLGFFIDLQGNLNVKATNGAWHLGSAGRDVAATFVADSKLLGSFSGKVTRPEQAEFRLGNNPAVFQDLRKKYALTLSGDVVTPSLSLASSSAALPRMAECVPRLPGSSAPPAPQVVSQAMHLPPGIPPSMLGAFDAYVDALSK